MAVMSPATACAYVRATNRTVVSFKLQKASAPSHKPPPSLDMHLPSSSQNASPHPVILSNGLYCHPIQLCACASAASATATKEAAVSARPACNVCWKHHHHHHHHHQQPHLRWHSMQRQRKFRHEAAAAKPPALLHLVLHRLSWRQVGRPVVVVGQHAQISKLITTRHVLKATDHIVPRHALEEDGG